MKDSEKSKLIVLKQAPVISSDGINEVAKRIEKIINNLDIDNQVATVETLKSLKEDKSFLNKEFKTLEEQRKAVKKAVSKPYDDFEEIYKKKISSQIKKATDKLSDKINSVEDELKKAKEKKVKSYFNELAQSKEIDFVSFEDMGLSIIRSTSEKKYKEQVDVFLNKIQSDINTINVLPEDAEFKAEAIAEYKQTRDLNKSLKVIQERKKAKEIELEKQKQLETDIKAQEQTQEAPQAEILQAPEVEDYREDSEPVQQEEPQVNPVAQPVPFFPSHEPIFTSSDPIHSTPEPELLETTIKIKGTMEQLKAVKAFLLSHNI